MAYEVSCPNGHRLQVTEAHFGERVNCPTCNESFVVPFLGGMPPATPPTTPPQPGRPRLDPNRWANPEVVSKLSHYSLMAGRPMMAVGLVLVLLSRGCDNISKRGVERANAKVKAAQEAFEDDWERQRLDLRDKIAALEEKKEPKAEDQKTLSELKTQLTDLSTKQEKAKKAAESGSWRDLKTNARVAEANQRINGYWRELFFVFSSIVLALGLLSVSWTAQGAERWVSLIMLAIITFSIYIGGIAWASGVLGR